MTSELNDFRERLQAAGQPYSLWGFRICFVGFAFLLVAQIYGRYTFVMLGVAVILLAIGWAALIVAFVRRRRWAKAQAADLIPPPMPPLS